MIGIHIYYVSCLTDNYNKKKKIPPKYMYKKKHKKEKNQLQHKG